MPADAKRIIKAKPKVVGVLRAILPKMILREKGQSIATGGFWLESYQKSPIVKIN